MKIALFTFILASTASAAFAQPGERLSAAAKSDFQKGDYNSCISEYTALISAAPQHDGFYAERSRCRYLKGIGLKTNSGDATAESDAEKSLGLNSRNTAALNVRGLVKLYKKDETGAIADFSRMIEIEPQSLKAILGKNYENPNEWKSQQDSLALF